MDSDDDEEIPSQLDVEVDDKLNTVKCNNCAPPEDGGGEVVSGEVMTDTQDHNTGSDSEILNIILGEVLASRRAIVELNHENEILKDKVALIEKKPKTVKKNTQPFKKKYVPRVGFAGRPSTNWRSRSAAFASNIQHNKTSNKNQQWVPADNNNPTNRNHQKHTQGRIMIVGKKAPNADDSTRPKLLPTTSSKINIVKVHVTGISTDVNAASLYKHLKEIGKINPISVTRLSSKVPTCNRFCVEVIDGDYDNIFDDHIWDEGAVVSDFRGRIYEQYLIESYPRYPKA